MGLLIKKADFVGKWELVKSNKDNIDAFIDLYEERYLIDLLGLDLFELFKADVDVHTMKPVTDIYLKIYNRLQFKSGFYLMNSEGMRDMLLCFLYYEINTAKQLDQSMSGPIKLKTEVSDPASNVFMYQFYNRAIEAFTTIQSYIVTNRADYDLFEGIRKIKASFI